jgi:Mitochondrial carrier protein
VCRALPSWAVSCIAGAVGECGGQLFLYPVETVKVLCQQSGKSAAMTLAMLVRTRSPLAAMSRLFNGVSSTMAVSAFLGAAYLCIFKESTAYFSGGPCGELTPPSLQSPALSAGVCAPAFVPGWDADDREQEASDPGQAPAYYSTREGKPERQEGGSVAAGASLRGVVLSALATSVALALLTGPIEMARNRMQAGVERGNLLAYTLSARGLRDTAPLLGPFCLTAVPHDFAELVTIFVGGAAVEVFAPAGLVRRELLDAAVGCVAGAFGVLLSAPADCIKTKVLTMSLGTAFVRSHKNPAALLAAGTAAKWRAAAAHTVATQGWPGLFVGVWPRLVDEVPGSMLHWSLVEACYRWLGGGRPS